VLSQLSVTWQRELLEHLGVEMDHGCRALGEIPRRFGDDEEVMTAFSAFQQACQNSARKALAARSGSEEGERKPLRFPPKKKLQTTGPLTREFLLAFSRKCAEVLTSDESIQLLSECPDMRVLSQLSVTWQRELLEHLGVEADHGCQELAMTPRRFGDDAKVMNAFTEFTKSCELSARRALERKRDRIKGSSTEGGTGSAVDVS
jgi:hypothetical protein